MYTKLFILAVTLVFCGAADVRSVKEGAFDDGLELSSVEETVVLESDLGRITIEGSNLPTTWQVAAASALRTAYELQTTDEGRIELFISLFTEAHPEYQWNAVVNYQHVYYIANYYIRLRTDDGDVVFVFSSNS